MILEQKVESFQQTGDFSLGRDILDVSYPVAEKIIQSKYRSFGYTEDLRSESHDAIVAAIYSFKPEKQTKYLTYLSRCIHNKIINFIKRKNVAGKYIYKEKPCHFSSISEIDIINSLQELSVNHLDCLMHGTGSRSMRFRAKRKLLNKIK